MALTKVSGNILDPGIDVAGIVTATGFDGPMIGGGGSNSGILTCTQLDLNGNGDVSGNFVVHGDFTVNGTTTTIDTILKAVDRIEVSDNSTNVAVAITQAGTGSIFKLYDNTAEVFTVADGGNVGINETSPDRDLHISNTTPYIRVESTSANQPATLELYHTRANGSDKWPVSVSTDDAALAFNVANAANGSPTEKLRIHSNGAVSVGGAIARNYYGALNVEKTATSAAAIDILASGTDAQAISFGNHNNISGELRVTDNADISLGTATNHPFIFYTNGHANERVRITGAGNVGINEDNPQSALHLKSMSSTLNVDTYPQLTIETAATDGAANKGGGILFLNHDGTGGSFGGSIQSLKENATSGNTAHYMRFSTRAAGGALTEKLRITSDGDVAITTRGSVEGVSKLNVEIPARTTAFSASDGDTWHDVLIENPGDAQTNAVGLAFQVTGDSYHKNAGTGIAAVKNGTASDYGADLVFITRGQNVVASEKLRIKSDGQVTKQHSCAFHYTPNGNQTLNNGDTITSWKSTDSRGFENINSGSYLSSGVFTAPVTGAYFMTAQLLLSDVGSSDTSIHLMWVKNSSTHTYWNTRFHGNSVGYGNYEAVIGSTTVYLTAGQTMKIAITLSGTVGFYGTDQNWGHWSGFLIG